MASLKDLQLGTRMLKPFAFKHRKGTGETIDVRVALRPLTKHELDLARMRSHATIVDLNANLKEGKTFEELLDDARVVEVLSVACRNPEKPEEQWATAMEMAMTLLPGEIAVLWTAYTAAQQECNPQITDMTMAEFNATIDQIAREGTADPFVHFGWNLQQAFIVTLARQLVTSRMESSSNSSATTDTASSSENESPESDRNLMAEMDVLHEQIAALRVRVAAVEGAAPSV